MHDIPTEIYSSPSEGEVGKEGAPIIKMMTGDFRGNHGEASTVDESDVRNSRGKRVVGNLLCFGPIPKVA